MPKGENENFELDLGATPEELIDETKFVPINGERTLSLSEWSKGESKKGNPQIVWIFTVLDSENIKENGQKLYHYTGITGPGRKHFTLTALSLGGVTNWSDGKVTKDRLDDLIGGELRARIVTEEAEEGEYAGEPQNRIKKILGPVKKIR